MAKALAFSALLNVVLVVALAYVTVRHTSGDGELHLSASSSFSTSGIRGVRANAAPPPTAAAAGGTSNEAASRRPFTRLGAGDVSEGTVPYGPSNRNRSLPSEMRYPHRQLVAATHVPVVGKHVFADLFDCDRELLNDEEVIRDMLVRAARVANATLLDLTAHTFRNRDPAFGEVGAPMGVTALALLSESHIAIHTWPEHGLAAADVFTCGSTDPAKAMRLLERELGADRALTQWSTAPRGGRFDERDEDQLLYDRLATRTLIASARSEYQTITVYDVEDFLQQSGRVLYLDGVLQSSASDEAVYHEALVHPAMTLHPRPERVMVLGGGEGATLREVLVHRTVQRAIMAELDGVVVNISRTYLEQWHAGAFDDPRTELYIGDGIQHLRRQELGSLDVVIMDLLDPAVAEYTHDPSAFLSEAERTASARVAEAAANLEEVDRTELVSGDENDERDDKPSRVREAGDNGGDPHVLARGERGDRGAATAAAGLADATGAASIVSDSIEEIRLKTTIVAGASVRFAHPLYSEDFFRDISARLREDGILATHVGGASVSETENYATMRRVLLELRKVFPTVVAYSKLVQSFQSEYVYFLACRTPGCGLGSVHPRNVPPAALNRRIERRVHYLLSHYDGEAHTAMFHLPRVIRDELFSCLRYVRNDLVNEHSFISLIESTAERIASLRARVLRSPEDRIELMEEISTSISELRNYANKLDDVRNRIELARLEARDQGLEWDDVLTALAEEDAAAGGAVARDAATFFIEDEEEAEDVTAAAAAANAAVDKSVSKAAAAAAAAAAVAEGDGEATTEAHGDITSSGDGEDASEAVIAAFLTSRGESTESARANAARLKKLWGAVTPEEILASIGLDEEEDDDDDEEEE